MGLEVDIKENPITKISARALFKSPHEEGFNCFFDFDLDLDFSWALDQSYSVFLRLVGAIFKASRYLATVLLAQSMPCSLSISES